MKKEIEWEVFHSHCNRVYQFHSHYHGIVDHCWELYDKLKLPVILKREDKGLCTEKNCPIWNEHV
jgi:hypothetical protein